MIEAFQIASLILSLAPQLRVAVKSLVQAFKSGDELDIRRAYEAAARVAFAARQKR